MGPSETIADLVSEVQIHVNYVIPPISASRVRIFFSCCFIQIRELIGQFQQSLSVPGILRRKVADNNDSQGIRMRTKRLLCNLMSLWAHNYQRKHTNGRSQRKWARKQGRIRNGYSTIGCMLNLLKEVLPLHREVTKAWSWRTVESDIARE
jgi:hypothetical protein